MNIQQFRAQQYKPGDQLVICTGRRHPRTTSIRVLAVLDEGHSTGVIGESSDGGLWAADAEYIIGQLVSPRVAS